MAQRTKVLPHQVTGKIADWKGQYGWIQADKPINHPDAQKRGGKIYLSVNDVEAEITGIGSPVSFFVYADGSGLGAMNCRPVAAQPSFAKVVQLVQSAPRTAATPYGGAAATTNPERQRISAALTAGKIKDWKGAFGWITPNEPVNYPGFKGQVYVHGSDVDPATKAQLAPGSEVLFSLYADKQGLGADRVQLGTASARPALAAWKPPSAAVAFASNKFPVGGKPPSAAVAFASNNNPVGGKPPSAAVAFASNPVGGTGPVAHPNLPRERITDMQTTGEVVDWKGTYGWVMPSNEIEHPEARKRGGKIYLAKKDCKVGMQIAPGTLVQFHVFVDASGLGAEDCSEF